MGRPLLTFHAFTQSVPGFWFRLRQRFFGYYGLASVIHPASVDRPVTLRYAKKHLMPLSHLTDLTAFHLAQTAQKLAIQARRRKRNRRDQTNKQPTSPDKQPSRSQKQRLGDHYEALALEHLRQAGCRLIGQQLRCPLGELDLVVQDGQTLVFVEVRYRKSIRFGGAAASITRVKQQRMLKTIDWWLPKLVREVFGGQMPMCRIDLAIFEQNNLTWHRDALRLSQDK